MADGEAVVLSAQNALGEKVAPVAPLGEAGRVAVTPAPAANDPAVAAAAAAAEAAKVVAKPAEGSRDTMAAAEAAVTAAKTPEEKAAAQAALDKLKPPVDAAKVEKITAAKTALAAATDDKAKAAAQRELDILEGKDVPGVAPETYTDFKLPDGQVVDKARMEAFLPLAKELNLSQSQAQRLIDMEGARVAQAQKDHITAWNQLLTDRLAEAKKDPEVGGAKYDENIGYAQQFIKAFGTPALQSYLNVSDAGSHVEIIRAFAAAGRAVANDTLHLGGATVKTGDVPLADRLFPSTAKK